MTITVIEPTVTASLSALPSSGYAPLQVQLTLTRTGNASGPIQYRVDFTSDGTFDATTTSDQATYGVGYSYASAGTYTAKACVTQQGVESCATATVTARYVAPAGQRSIEDRPDEQTGVQIHLVYMIPSDGVDRALDTNGSIETSWRLGQGWMIGQTRGKQFREDTHQEKVDITFIRATQPDSVMSKLGGFILREAYNQLVNAGFTDFTTKKYLIYYDANNTGGCGIAEDKLAVLILRGGCSNVPFTNPSTVTPGFWEFVGLHETVHIFGHVDPSAPNHNPQCGNHVMDSNEDLLYCGNKGSWNPTTLDVNGDDYYGDNVPAGVRNLKYDPILIPAPASVMASVSVQAQQQQGVMLPPFIHDVVKFKP